MVTNCKLTLIAAPAQDRAAQESGLPVAHLAYRAGGGPHLFRANLPVAARGGLLALDCEGFDGRGEPSAFCQEILRECAARGFHGVYCAFEGRPFPVLQRAVAELGSSGPPGLAPLCARVLQRRVGHGPGPYPHRHLRRLAGAASDRGGRAVRSGAAVLLLERVAEDFFLPSPTGQGVPLSRDALRQKREEHGASVFFSHELCAHYFTYMSGENGAHFVLFDDAGSIRKKCQAAVRLGIGEAFLPYSQAEDLLPALLEA